MCDFILPELEHREKERERETERERERDRERERERASEGASERASERTPSSGNRRPACEQYISLWEQVTGHPLGYQSSVTAANDSFQQFRGLLSGAFYGIPIFGRR